MSDDSPKTQLLKSGLRAKRSFGQNFLADSRLAARIAELATAPAGGEHTRRCVLEIGAGFGALTAPLLERAKRVVAIERDRDLIAPLAERFADEITDGRLRLVEADAKTWPFEEAFDDDCEQRTIAGNLPYQITGPLLRRAVESHSLASRFVFLVQLEVADRLVAAPNTESYGALTVFLQARFSTERAFVVRRGAFYPQPNVDSAVVVLTPRRDAGAPDEETPLFRHLVRAAFAQRRKKLRNAWANIPEIETAQLVQAARRLNVDLERRGETLTVEAFVALARELES